MTSSASSSSSSSSSSSGASAAAAAESGSPADFSPAYFADLKRSFHRRLYELAAGPARQENLEKVYHPAMRWSGAHPLEQGQGTDWFYHRIWTPLRHAFPDLERRDSLLLAGAYKGELFIAALGHYCATFQRDYLSIPATGRPIYLRYGEIHRLKDTKVVESYCLWDILDLIRQAGFWPLAPSLGTEGLWPGPLTGDGLDFTPSDPAESEKSIRQTLAMHKALADYDDRAQLSRETLLEMPQKEFWHKNMMWYGAAGIGTTRGLAGFVDYHQLPFREAFPNRQGGDQWETLGELKHHYGGGHILQIGDGAFSVTGGWPSVYAEHLGPNFLGVGPTKRPVTMRVMDFYLHHEGKIRENWVPLDMLDLLAQMGVDVLHRMQSLFQRGTRPASPVSPPPPA